MCKTEGCVLETVGKSKYCAEHRAIAREKFKENIEKQKQEKAEREIMFENLYMAASEAGDKAAKECMPTPMIVQQTVNMLDDTSPVVKQYHVPEGMCGFAWVNVRPGNCAFANWLKKKGLASKAYRGGVEIWISAYGQSYERKQACAYAMADVFEAAGIKAYGGSRLD